MSSSAVSTELLPVLFLDSEEDTSTGPIAFIVDVLSASSVDVLSASSNDEMTNAESLTAELFAQSGILENSFQASCAIKPTTINSNSNSDFDSISNSIANSHSNAAIGDFFVSTTQQSSEFAQVSRVYDSFARALKLASKL